MSNVQLKNTSHSRGSHREYLGDESAPRDDAGNHTRTKAVNFFRGKSSVEGQTRQQLKDKGII